MTPVVLKGIGLIAPGLPDWQSGKAVLSGAAAYREQPLAAFKTQLLPANERRRLPQTAKLALSAAEAALQDAARRSGSENITPTITVFASSSGDNQIVDKICNALLLPERPVSPTHFHNSVHNAPAGYWSIATQCRQPSVSLSAGDGSFAAGLIEAATIVASERSDVLLVAYDQPAPEPLASTRPLVAPFASALLIGLDDRAPNRCTLNLQLSWEQAQQSLSDPALERLHSGNPAARSLPLLISIAARTNARLFLPYVMQRTLCIDIEHGDDRI